MMDHTHHQVCNVRYLFIVHGKLWAVTVSHFITPCLECCRSILLLLRLSFADNERKFEVAQKQACWLIFFYDIRFGKECLCTMIHVACSAFSFFSLKHVTGIRKKRACHLRGQCAIQSNRDLPHNVRTSFYEYEMSPNIKANLHSEIGILIQRCHNLCFCLWNRTIG